MLECNFFVLETTPFTTTVNMALSNLAEIVWDRCRRVRAMLLLSRLILDFDAHNLG